MKPYIERLQEAAQELGRKVSNLETHYHHGGYTRVRKGAYVDPRHYNRWYVLDRELARVRARIRRVRGETTDGNDSD